MSESILKALMRLFAIIADVEIGENGEINNPGRIIAVLNVCGEKAAV